MEFNQFLAEQIAKIRVRISKDLEIRSGASRAEAIEYLKEKGYELTETNVEMALKNLSSQNNYQAQLDGEISSLMQKNAENPEYIVDTYNFEMFNLLNIPRTGVNPVVLLNDAEKVVLSNFVFLKIDSRCYEEFDDYFKDIVKTGLVGRIYVTDNKILVNYVPSVLPVVETACFNISEICSYGVSGLDELFFVLKSGQKITVSLGMDAAIDFVKKIAKLV